MRNNKRRPYRVVKKQKNDNISDTNSICFLKNKKNFITVFTIAVCAFIDGVIIGHLLSKNN